MGFELRFTDKEITAWGGMALMKQMLDHLGFDQALATCGLPQPQSNPWLPARTTHHPIHALDLVRRQPV
jgi:hypothetical protein